MKLISKLGMSVRKEILNMCACLVGEIINTLRFSDDVAVTVGSKENLLNIEEKVKKHNTKIIKGKTVSR